jgi:hypothetical protein
MLIAAIVIVVAVVWYLAPMKGTGPTTATPEASPPAATEPAPATTPGTPAPTTP